MTHPTHPVPPMGAVSTEASVPVFDKPPCVALLSATLNLSYLVPAFKALEPEIDLRMDGHWGNVDDIDAAVCWEPPHNQLMTFPKLQLVQALSAGVDHILSDPTLPRSVPMCRIVDPNMASGMVAYVTWAVIHRQRHMDRYLRAAMQHEWRTHPVVPTYRTRVGIAGLGTLGMACARALRALGYTVRGWNRSAKADLPDGVTSFVGKEALNEFLSGCDTLICLLPLTPATRGFLDAACFDALPKGAHLINVGRGDHLVEADLLAALASGQIGAATLDAFSTEPLPADHPFWQDERVIVTPHIATRTGIDVIALQTLQNLATIRAGKRPTRIVDLDAGY